MRLVIILLLLVVLPTAMLSLIAGHSIQARELILNRRLEESAIKHIDRVGEQIGVMLAADMELVGAAFRETVLAGDAPAVMRRREPGLCAASHFVQAAYLFMNPWNFVYPSQAEAGDAVKDLRQVLPQQIAGMLRRQQSIIYVREQELIYCFAPLSGYLDLYCGFRLDRSRALKVLNGLMDAESASGIELRIETTRSGAGTDAPAPLISDSFNPRPKPVAAEGAHSGGDDCLARGSLPEPFAHIAIAAYLVGEDDIRRAEALESNLIKWGVSLLAVVIIVSSVILILLTVRQATLARRRSEFVVGMSHDLRTPVAAMQILADSLCAGRVSSAEKRQEFLCSIASECSRLADMIERVLFFFRQEHGAMTYTIQECNLDDIIQSAVKSVAVRLPADFSLGVDLGDTGEHFVKADAGALAKVLVNLLDNAIKYGQSPGGGRSSIDVRVSVKRHLLRDWVVISVVDHGCGIEPREHRKIFRRFYRVGSEGSHIGGIGLGLFLCYDIVRVHGGRIRVLSRPGCGAEFQVWLKRYGRKNSER